MTPVAQFFRQLYVVVDFAVGHEGHIPVPGQDGLLTTLQVDDGQSGVSQPERTLREKAGPVRSPMSQPGGHGLQRLTGNRGPRNDYTSDATHVRLFPDSVP
jgi:hypothetical protein